jgi:hypothetical protein
MAKPSDSCPNCAAVWVHGLEKSERKHQAGCGFGPVEEWVPEAAVKSKPKYESDKVGE